MKRNIGNIFFLLGFFLLQLSIVFVNVEFLHSYLNEIKFLSLLILAIGSIIKLGKMKIGLKSFLIIVLLSVVGVYSYFKTDDTLFIKFFLVMLCASNIPFEKLVKYDLSIKLFLLFSLVFLYYLGFTNSFVVMRGDLIRKSFGFYHPNTFAMYLTLIYFEYIYLKRSNIRLGHVLLGFLIVFIILKFSDSRTAVLCLLLFILFLVGKKMLKGIMKSRICFVFIKNFFLIGTIVTILLTTMYLNHDLFARKLNELFSYRLYLQGIYLSEYDIHFLGNSITYISTLDSAYLKLLLNFGVAVSLLIDYIYRNIIKKAYQNKDYMMCVIFIIFMVYGFMENLMFDISYNIFWLFFVSLLFRRGKDEREC